jgi:hypothetical protein
MQLAGTAIDGLVRINGMAPFAARPGWWEVKPAVFARKVPDGHGPADPNIGVIWYAQPYRGASVATDEMRARTIVEAALSDDGGVSFDIAYTLTVNDPVIFGVPSDPNGMYFHPCQGLSFEADGTPDEGYFGEYISGAFRDAVSRIAIGAWGDSREGCQSQAIPNTWHQHVFAGRGAP